MECTAQSDVGVADLFVSVTQSLPSWWKVNLNQQHLILQPCSVYLF